VISLFRFYFFYQWQIFATLFGFTKFYQVFNGANERMTTVQTKKSPGNVVVVAERCKGCSFCVDFCPPHALVLSDQYNARGYHPPVLKYRDLCTGCNICGLMCPDFAIYGFITKRK
jgi:2-oxoglutarate ferredoxin oxidoreductase subunit delta